MLKHIYNIHDSKTIGPYLPLGSERFHFGLHHKRKSVEWNDQFLEVVRPLQHITAQIWGLSGPGSVTISGSSGASPKTFSLTQGAAPEVVISNNVTPASGTAYPPVAVTVNYTVTPTTTIIFYVDGSIAYAYFGNGTSGTANWTTPGLSAGTHSIIISTPNGSASTSYVVKPAWDLDTKPDL